MDLPSLFASKFPVLCHPRLHMAASAPPGAQTKTQSGDVKWMYSSDCIMQKHTINILRGRANGAWHSEVSLGGILAVDSQLWEEGEHAWPQNRKDLRYEYSRTGKWP